MKPQFVVDPKTLDKDHKKLWNSVKHIDLTKFQTLKPGEYMQLPKRAIDKRSVGDILLIGATVPGVEFGRRPAGQ
jgi:hypothetical protein